MFYGIGPRPRSLEMGQNGNEANSSSSFSIFAFLCKRIITDSRYEVN